MEFETDSGDYFILSSACKYVAKNKVQGIIAEIGTRRGGSSKIIVDSLVENGRTEGVFLSIDPYGNIDFEANDSEVKKYNYTNSMRDETIPKLHTYIASKGYNFIFMCMEDTEFYLRFADALPVYAEKKELIEDYALAFIDGPHSTSAVLDAAEFFVNRQPVNGCLVFDDVNYYKHDEVEQYLFENGYNTLVGSNIKKAYVRIMP